MARSVFQTIDSVVGLSPSPVPPRRARLPQFVGSVGDPQAALDAVDITLCGAGSIGRNMAVHLARAQIGTVRLIDPGRYKPESLLTHPIMPADVGKPKASNTGRLCKDLSPTTHVLAHDGPIQSLEVTELAETDLVVMATDNLAAEVEAGQRCLHLGKPVIQASVHGGTLVAQVRFFGNRNDEGACPACGYGVAERALLNQETIFSCEGLAAGQTIAQTKTLPTVSTSFLCALAADLALTLAFRHLLRLGPVVHDSLVEYCGYTNRMVTAPLVRNPQCRCDHTAWTVVPAPGHLGDCTLDQLAAAAGDANGAAFTVDDLAFAEKGYCDRCGEQSVRRFVAAGEPAGRCPTCDRPLVAQPFYTHRVVPISLLSSITDRPLRYVGAAAPRSVLVRGAQRTMLFRQTGP